MEQSVGVQVPLYPRQHVPDPAAQLPGAHHATHQEGSCPLELTINTISQTEQEAHITLTSSELQPHFEEAYQKFRPKAELKGFRKGKVPMDMIRQLYGEAIEQDALDTIANEFFQKAIEEKKIEPIGRPSLVDMDFQRGKSLNFKIKYEVKPVIELKKYKGLKVEKPVHAVMDEEVEAEIEQIRRSNSTNTEVQTVTDEEHLVTGSVQELDEQGTPLIGRKTSQAKFLLSDTTLVKEIRDALRAAEVGQTYRVSFTNQHDDHTHTVNAAITVTKIEKVNLPLLDEALVKKVTGDKVSSVEQFRKDMHADIERYWNEQADRKLNNALIDEAIRLHDFPAPESLVNAFLESFMEEMKGRTRDRQLPRDFDEKKFREENRAYAIWQAKWMLLRDEIAAAEKIEVTDADLTALAEADATRSGIEKDRLLQYYRNTSSVADRLLTDRVVAVLRSNATITETSDKK